jgi:hypothetical protein
MGIAAPHCRQATGLGGRGSDRDPFPEPHLEEPGRAQHHLPRPSFVAPASGAANFGGHAMSTPCLHDPDVFPSDQVLADHLGRNAVLWDSLSSLIRTAHTALSMDWKYYRDGKTWLCKVAKKKKVMCWVSIWPGMFKVTFYFGSKNDAAIGRARIAPPLKRAFLDQKGRTKFRPLTIDVRTKSALHDVRELLELRERIN